MASAFPAWVRIMQLSLSLTAAAIIETIAMVTLRTHQAFFLPSLYFQCRYSPN